MKPRIRIRPGNMCSVVLDTERDDFVVLLNSDIRRVGYLAALREEFLAHEGYPYVRIGISHVITSIARQSGFTDFGHAVDAAA